MFTFIAKTKEIVFDILFPPLCAGCRLNLTSEEKNDALCANCFSKIEINSCLTCPICASRLALNKKTCHPNAAYRLAAASNYDNRIVKDLIWNLKYNRQSYAASPLAKILFLHLKLLKLNFENYLLVPVPLHPSREHKRGFNQVELIADALSRKTGLPVLKSVLERVKNSPPQAETKSFEERHANIKNSFRVSRLDLIVKKNIILLDDVFTSGATITEAIKTLRAAGAEKIVALVAARA